MTTKTIKYKVMLADEGGLQILEDGQRYITESNDNLRRMIGDDVYCYLEEKGISDAEVTITIEHE